MTVNDACSNELKTRMDQIKLTMKSAQECWMHDDFLQCAVRLQDLERYGKFTELEMNIFDAGSTKDHY